MSTTQPGDVDQLRTEIESLRGQLASERKQRSIRIRNVFTWILVVLAVLATTLALLTLWTFRTLNNTELFVDRVGSIIEQPEVAQAIGNRAAAQLVEALELEDRIAEVLPERAVLVAGPITTAAQNYLAQGTTKLIETDQFQQAWDVALAEGHELTIDILSGSDTTAIENSNGVIVLNITPVINALLAEGADFLSDLLNRDINPPAVTPENIDAAISALEEQLGMDLPNDFGTITLFESDDLAAAQNAYETAKAVALLAPLAALVLIGLAVAVSLRRLHTFLIIVLGVALSMLLVQLALAPVQDSLVGAVADQGLKGAVDAAFSTVTDSLISGIAVVMILGIIAAGLLFVLGDSRPAQVGRQVLGQSPALAARYQGPFLVGGAVIGLVLLAIIPGRTWGQLLFVLLLYAAFALAVLLAPKSDAEQVESAAEAQAGA